ncbi:hypothetical protein Dda_1402 [Drechslerella dactyloides]|uniref:Profilin n=1 Tax=Drechslerella dactyloides TaxID=74499 RepID=A0AAD6J412_DREDA|nr:hypothetical protein Dda_1402 [Drechslerella dactyloides]
MVSLVGSGNVDAGAIFSAAGDSVWANSSGFNVSPDEIKSLVQAYALPDKSTSSLWGEGLHIAGVKYVCTKVDDRSIYGKKGKTGVCIVKTKQAIVIARYPDTVQTQSAATTTEGLADYLIKTGY